MNQFRESAVIALQAIWSNKLRSFLTVLGNIVAVTSIIAVVSLIQGMNAYVTNAIVTDVGADNFTIQRNPVVRTAADEERVRSNPPITMDDADAVRKFGDNIIAVATQGNGRTKITYKNVTLNSVQIQGVSREYIYFSTFDADRGRPISPTEVDRDRLVAILGYETAEQLFGPADPIDKSIRIRNMQFRVVGVSEKKGSIFGQRMSLQILVKPRTPDVVKAAMDDATVAMRIERRLRPKEADNFGMFSSESLLNLYHTATNGIFAVLLGVVALSLVVGGIVIMNIMLMVVSERTREIGLRKALGARRRDIMWQIMTESVTLSSFGGLVGIGLGFLLALAISSATPLPAAVQLWSVAIGLGITALVGLFFGMYPAMRAAALDPIDALRRE
jgi:putative ABC transport system permease protein